MSLGDLIELPNGTRLYYVDENHSYWRCNPDSSRGRRLTGVSTVSAPMDFKPDNLMRWASRLTLEGVSRAYAGQKVPGDPFVLRQRLEDAGLNWEAVRDDAATRGTNVHMLTLHALALGGEVPSLDDLEAHERGYGQAVMSWWNDRQPKVLHAEQVVLDEEHGFAGRVDLHCVVHGEDLIAPERWVVDAKTSGFISGKHHAQIAGYDRGLIASGLAAKPADRLVILQLKDDGSYCEVTGQATHEDFLAALRVYRAAGRIGGAARREREQMAA